MSLYHGTSVKSFNGSSRKQFLHENLVFLFMGLISLVLNPSQKRHLFVNQLQNGDVILIPVLGVRAFDRSQAA